MPVETKGDEMKLTSQEIKTRAQQIEQLMSFVQDSGEQENAAPRRYLKVIITKMLEEKSYDKIKSSIKDKGLEKAVLTLIREQGLVDEDLNSAQILDQMTDYSSKVFAQLNRLTSSLSRLSQAALASLSS